MAVAILFSISEWKLLKSECEQIWSLMHEMTRETERGMKLRIQRNVKYKEEQ